MNLYHPISRESLVGSQREGAVAPNIRDGGLVNPPLIQSIQCSDVFDDFDEAASPVLVVIAAVEENLSFSTYLS